jgi:tubulin polyglutamylase TTLL6/13
MNKQKRNESPTENFDDDDSENDSEDGSDDSDSPRRGKGKNRKSAKKNKKPVTNTLVFDVSDTQYEIVKFVGRKIYNWKLTWDQEAEWDVRWTDNAVQPETLAKMQEHQRINHFPGMYSLARKNHLGKNLMRMRKHFPDNFKFFPPTWLLPSELSDFRAQFTKKKNRTFIVKPEASSQGRGIFLTRNIDAVQPGEHFVAQRYLCKPYLIDGLKFDLRLYVLLAGCDPLRIYLYNDGLVRFATETYVSPTPDNLENICMHLTNYAINKDNPNFIFNENAENDNVGHKRGIKAVFRLLEEQGHDIKKLWDEIKRIIIKTFASVQPILAHSYKSCHPDEPYNNMCFELLGFDIMLDHKLKPWLIEVNHTPSFTTDTPLDRTIKKGAIKDALKLMNCTLEFKNKIKAKKQAELRQRVLTGKKVRPTPDERIINSQHAQRERDLYEAKNCGDYEKIFPFDDPSEAIEDYNAFLQVSQTWWEDWTGTTRRKLRQQAETNKPPPFVFGNSSYNQQQHTMAKAKEIQSVYSVQKPKQTISIQKPPSQNSKRPDNSQQNITMPNTGSTPLPNLQKSQSFNPMELVQEEDREFMEQVDAFEGCENHAIRGEDDQRPPSRGLSDINTRSSSPHKSLVQSVATLTKLEEKLGETYAEPETDKSPMSHHSNNGGKYVHISISPERQGSASSSTKFRIRTQSTNNSIQASGKTPLDPIEDNKFLFSKKYAHYLNSSLPNGGLKGLGNGDLFSKLSKVPLRLSNGVIGEVADYKHDNEERSASTSLVVKHKNGSKDNSKKYSTSPPNYALQGKYPVGNYVQPKLMEFNLPFSKHEEPSQRLGGGFAIPGAAGSNVVIKPQAVKKEYASVPGNFNYPHDQVNLQKYYNIFYQNKK